MFAVTPIGPAIPAYLSVMSDGIDEVARNAGIEADVEQARQWMTSAAAANRNSGRIVVDPDIGVFGDPVSLLDFNPADVDLFRGMVPHVRLASHPRIESAIAIAGSAAQGRIQLFPGDRDFFERVHIHADSRAEAERIFRAAFKMTALRATAEPDIVLLEADLGTFGEAVVRKGVPVRAGHTIEWTTPEIVAGRLTAAAADGSPRTYTWDETEVGGGWIYLYWIIADRSRERIAIASNIIDLSWEGADGVVHSFDGAIDPLVQEIYLEPAALPLVRRLQPLVRPGAREAYQQAMREEVRHYLTVEPSYGKVAKRLYNLFRVGDELEAAAYVRELFDEPSAGLYQVSGLLEAAAAALDPDSGIPQNLVLEHLDALSVTLAAATTGDDETRLLAALGQLRASVLAADQTDDDWTSTATRVRASAANLVNDFFRTRLLAHPRVSHLLRSYLTAS